MNIYEQAEQIVLTEETERGERYDPIEFQERLDIIVQRLTRQAWIDEAHEGLILAPPSRALQPGSIMDAREDEARMWEASKRFQWRENAERESRLRRPA